MGITDAALNNRIQTVKGPDLDAEIKNLFSVLAAGQRAANRGGGGGGGGGSGGMGKLNWIFDEETGKFVPVPGGSEKIATNNFAAMKRWQAKQAINSDAGEGVRKKLAEFDNASVEKQAEMLSQMRKEDIPALAKATNVNPALLIEQALGEATAAHRKRKTEIDKQSTFGTGADSGKIGFNRFLDNIADIFSNGEEQVARAKRREEYEEEIRKQNPVLDNLERRRREGADAFDLLGSKGGIVSTIGETVGEMGGPLALIGGVGGGVAKGAQLAGKGINAVNRARMAGTAAAGAFTGAGQQITAGVDRINADQTLTDEQKAQLADDMKASSMALGGAIGAVAFPFAEPAMRAVGRSVANRGIGNSLTAQAVRRANERGLSREVAEPFISAARAADDEAVIKALNQGGLGGFMSGWARGIPLAAVENTALAVPQQMAANAQYGRATGKPVDITEGVGDAILGSVLSAPLLGAFSRPVGPKPPEVSARDQLLNATGVRAKVGIGLPEGGTNNGTIVPRSYDPDQVINPDGSGAGTATGEVFDTTFRNAPEGLPGQTPALTTGESARATEHGPIEQPAGTTTALPAGRPGRTTTTYEHGPIPRPAGTNPRAIPSTTSDEARVAGDVLYGHGWEARPVTLSGKFSNWQSVGATEDLKNKATKFVTFPGKKTVAKGIEDFNAWKQTATPEEVAAMRRLLASQRQADNYEKTYSQKQREFIDQVLKQEESANSAPTAPKTGTEQTTTTTEQRPEPAPTTRPEPKQTTTATEQAPEPSPATRPEQAPEAEPKQAPTTRPKPEQTTTTTEQTPEPAPTTRPESEQTTTVEPAPEPAPAPTQPPRDTVAVARDQVGLLKQIGLDTTPLESALAKYENSAKTEADRRELEDALPASSTITREDLEEVSRVANKQISDLVSSGMDEAQAKANVALMVRQALNTEKAFGIPAAEALNRKRFANGYQKAADVADTMNTKSGPEVDDPVAGGPILYQTQNLPEWEAAMRKHMKVDGATPEEIEQRVAESKFLSEFAEWIVARNFSVPHTADENLTPTTGNSDERYKVSIDFSTICTKREAMGATVNAIIDTLGRPLNEVEMRLVRGLYISAGEATPCSYCYLEPNRIAAMMDVANQLVSLHKASLDPSYKPDLSDKSMTYFKQAVKEIRAKGIDMENFNFQLLTNEILATEFNRQRMADVGGNKNKLTGLKKWKTTDAPHVYRFLAFRFNSHKAKAVVPYAEYKGQLFDLARKDPRFVAERNRNAGLRIFSNSDFRIEHYCDMSQVIFDCQTLGLKGHLYTKVPEFVDIYQNTGLKMNLSLFARRVNKHNSTDPRDWTFEVDPSQSQDLFFVLTKSRDFEHIGGMMMSVDENVIAAAMVHPGIFMIIPYHSSGATIDLVKAMEYQNFSSNAHEEPLKYKSASDDKDGRKAERAAAQVNPGDLGIDGGVTDTEGTIRYLLACKEKKALPRFCRFLFNGWKPIEGTTKSVQDRRAAAAKESKDRWRAIFDGDSDIKLTREWLDADAAKGENSVFNYNFFKLIKDYARTDTPFVVPDASKIDQATAMKYFEDYMNAGGEAKYLPNQAILNDAVDIIKGGHLKATRADIAQAETMGWDLHTLLMTGKKIPGDYPILTKKGGSIFQNSITQEYRWVKDGDEPPTGFTRYEGPNRGGTTSEGLTLNQNNQSDLRGQIRIGEGAEQDIITIFKNGDASTLPHETAHSYVAQMDRIIEDNGNAALRSMREQLPEGIDASDGVSLADVRKQVEAMPEGAEKAKALKAVEQCEYRMQRLEQLKADKRTLLRFADLPEDGPLTNEQRVHYQEQVARAFEQYVATGKAPTPELTGVFQRFFQWLKGIYQSWREYVGKDVPEEVYGVFDRWFDANSKRGLGGEGNANTVETSGLSGVGRSDAGGTTEAPVRNSGSDSGRPEGTPTDAPVSGTEAPVQTAGGRENTEAGGNAGTGAHPATETDAAASTVAEGGTGAENPNGGPGTGRPAGGREGSGPGAGGDESASGVRAGGDRDTGPTGEQNVADTTGATAGEQTTQAPTAGQKGVSARRRYLEAKVIEAQNALHEFNRWHGITIEQQMGREPIADPQLDAARERLIADLWAANAEYQTTLPKKTPQTPIDETYRSLAGAYMNRVDIKKAGLQDLSKPATVYISNGDGQPPVKFDHPLPAYLDKQIKELKIRNASRNTTSPTGIQKLQNDSYHLESNVAAFLGNPVGAIFKLWPKKEQEKLLRANVQKYLLNGEAIPTEINWKNPLTYTPEIHKQLQDFKAANPRAGIKQLTDFYRSLLNPKAPEEAGGITLTQTANPDLGAQLITADSEAGFGTAEAMASDRSPVMESLRQEDAQARQDAETAKVVSELSDLLDGGMYLGQSATKGVKAGCQKTANAVLRDIQRTGMEGMKQRMEDVKRIQDYVSGTQMGTSNWFINLKNWFFQNFTSDRGLMHLWLHTFARDGRAMDNRVIQAFEGMQAVVQAKNVEYQNRMKAFLSQLEPTAVNTGMSVNDVAELVGHYHVAHDVANTNALLLERWQASADAELAQARAVSAAGLDPKEHLDAAEKHLRNIEKLRIQNGEIPDNGRYDWSKEQILSCGYTNPEAEALMERVSKKLGLTRDQLNGYAAQLTAEFNFLLKDRAAAGVIHPNVLNSFPDRPTYAPMVSRRGVGDAPGNLTGCMSDANPYNPGKYYAIDGRYTRPDSSFISYQSYAKRAAIEIGSKDFGVALNAVYERLARQGNGALEASGLRRMNYDQMMAMRSNGMADAMDALYSRGGMVVSLPDAKGDMHRWFFNFKAGGWDAQGARFFGDTLSKSISSAFKMVDVMAPVDLAARGSTAMGMLSTRFTPLFAPVAALRDFAERTLNIVNRTYYREDGTAISGTTAATQFALNSATASNIVRQATLTRNLDPNSEAGRLWSEFESLGGVQRFTDRGYQRDINNMVRTPRSVEDLLNGPNGQNVVMDKLGLTSKPARQVFVLGSSASKKALAALDRWNDSWQNSAAFTHFYTLRKMGVSAVDAAAGTREMMNLSQRGKLGPFFQMLAPFVVPTVQAGTAMLRTLGFGANRLRDVPKEGLKGYLALLGAFGAYCLLQPLARDAMGTDENGNSRYDALPASELSRYLPISLGGDEYFKYPVGFGLPQIGALMAVGFDRVSQGTMKPQDLAFDVAFAAIQNMSPGGWPSFGFSEDPAAYITNMIVPQFAKPFAEVAMNTNSFGSSIYNPTTGPEQAKSDAGKMTTPHRYHDFARMANELFGIDTYPEAYRHLEQNFLRGPARFFTLWAQETDDIYKGADKPTALNSVPPSIAALGITSLYGRVTDATRNQFYTAKKAYDTRLRGENISFAGKPGNVDSAEYRQAILEEAGWEPEAIEDYITLYKASVSLRNQGRAFNNEFREKWRGMTDPDELKEGFNRLADDNDVVYAGAVQKLHYWGS